MRVTAIVRGATWQTSLFPDASTHTYLLPVKKSVRAATQLQAGDVVEAEVELET